MIQSLTQVTQIRLINLRWLSVAAMVMAALASPNILGSTELMPRLLAFATVVGCVNICLLVAATIFRANSEGIPLFSPLVQLTCDLAVWAVYVYLSGGATNPLISVFLPLVAIGAIVLSHVQAWVLGAEAILAYSFLWRFHQPLVIFDSDRAAQLHLLGMWLVFVVSAIVVIWFILQMTHALRERDAALADAREQAIRNDWVVSVGSLAAGAAHQLSTPLGTLNLLVDDLLADESLPSCLRPDMLLMRKQIDVCKHALNGITAQGAMPRRPAGSGLSLDAWLRQAVESWQALNPSGNIAIELPAEYKTLEMSFQLPLERALGNLFDNALRAGALHIFLTGTLDERNLVISIRDDGCGIPESALAAFAAGAPVTTYAGMGIGLLLARAAVERHSGRLDVARIGATGTHARVVFPIPRDQGMDK